MQPCNILYVSYFHFSDWRQIIHVGAIDCAEERNLATCTHYRVEGYPTVKVFGYDNNLLLSLLIFLASLDFV